MKIPGYTLHGDYYLTDEVISNKTWKEACKMRKFVNLPNGKMVIAHTLSLEELRTIPREERALYGNWYWTSTLTGDSVWFVNSFGDFGKLNCRPWVYYDGGIRLGFHKNEIKHFLEIE